MVLTTDNLTPIRSRMDELSQDVGSQCILLTDRAGIIPIVARSLVKFATAVPSASGRPDARSRRRLQPR